MVTTVYLYITDSMISACSGSTNKVAIPRFELRYLPGVSAESKILGLELSLITPVCTRSFCNVNDVRNSYHM